MKSRDEIGKNIFDFDDDGGGGGGNDVIDEGWNQSSLAALEDNTYLVRQREREIQKIVQSISELNTIFKDLASMVSEQVSSCHSKVHTGYCSIRLFWIVNPIQIHHKYEIDNPNPIFKKD